MLGQASRHKIWEERKGEGALMVKLSRVGSSKESYSKREKGWKSITIWAEK